MKHVVLITGANNGIGIECVKQFLEDNFIVIAISRNAHNLKQIYNNNLVIYECDVTDFSKLKAAIQSIVAKYQHIDGLINNAGVVYGGEFTEINHIDSQEMIDVNITGYTNVLKLIIPYMQEKKRGTILNISSLADRCSIPNLAIYAATKSYVKSLSESLRKSNAKYNIRITSLAPALIKTSMLDNINLSDQPTIEVSEFVKILKFIYMQPQDICIRDMVIAPTNYEG